MRFIIPQISIFLLTFLNFFSLIHSQQLYAAKATTNCSNINNSVLGYSCNGLNTTCQAFLIFRSQPPYTTVSSISTLFNTDPSRLSAINLVPETAFFDTNKQVIVPVNCSCSGTYSQANTTYVVKAGDAPFTIANNTFQGLSTCQAVQDQNRRSTVDIFVGDRLNIPVRCACPSKNQTDLGIKYLLSYLIVFGDTVNSISLQFGAETARTLEANQIDEKDTIYPFTTLLVPLQNLPSSNQTVEPPTAASPPPPPPNPPPSSGNSSSKTWIYVVVGLLGGIALTTLIGTIIFLTVFRKGRKRTDGQIIVSESFEAKEKPVNKKLDEESRDFLEDLSGITHSLKVYKFKELEAATDNFSTSCLIRGSVYRGLINGDYAAIKKINGDVSKEIDLLNKVNHFNLVRLSGVCFSDGQWYLVYEYADNGALSDWIYNNDGKLLSWTQRMQIAADVATGLNYLHSFASPPHVHKDIKSSNILLDSEFRAKIANLAMARAADGEFALTRHIVGTKGYMAPEYLENGLISTKLDVYAFGILILEIVTGKEVAALYTEENSNLSDMVSNVLSQGDVQESIRRFIDPSLEGNYSSELAVYVMRLIDSCLKKNSADRPAMDEIAQSLSRILTLTLNWESSNFSGYQSFSTSS